MEPSLNRFNTTEGPGYNQPPSDIHIQGWTKNEHYTAVGGFCGQNCPCCRAVFKEHWGACPICMKIKAYDDNDPDKDPEKDPKKRS